MAVKIRLTRGGRKKLPFYHIVAADERMPRDGRFIEKLGYWNPLKKDLNWNVDAVNAWLQKGAQPTGTIQKLILGNEGVGSEKQRASYQKSIDEKAAIVRKKQEAEAAKKAAEEAAAAAEAAAAEAEAAKDDATEA